MRYSIIVLVLLMAIAGCKQNNIVEPNSNSALRESKVRNGILYTFAVTNDKLGIFDTLNMSLAALNQTAVPETVYVGFSQYFYTWYLTDDVGRMINNGPWGADNSIRIVVISPHQSTLLYDLKYSMANIFGTPIKAGSYLLNWNLSNGLSFQLNLKCGKSENEITDPEGITSPVYPLKVGNQWKFKEKFILSNDTVMDGSTIIQTIVGEKIMDGEKWFLLSDNQLITARTDGIYSYYADIKAAVLKYKYPANTGEVYVSGDDLFNGERDTLIAYQMKVDSTNEVISVPGGLYTCYKYNTPKILATFGMEIIERDSEDMFLSNVGPVKIVYNDSNGKPNCYYELVSTNFQ
jgi:hypothetical protein